MIGGAPRQYKARTGHEAARGAWTFSGAHTGTFTVVCPIDFTDSPDFMFVDATLSSNSDNTTTPNQLFGWISNPNIQEFAYYVQVVLERTTSTNMSVHFNDARFSFDAI